MIDVVEAKSLGLINYVETPENLIPKAKEILSLIITKSPIVISRIIEAVNFYFNKEGFNEEAKLFGEVFSSADKKEGTAAFLEKRKPVFKGK
jgi:enoyl-CoA hydratase